MISGFLSRLRSHLARQSQWVLAFLILGAGLARLIPHPPNFTPVFATAIFAGAYVTHGWMAFVLVAASMLIADSVIGFHTTMPYVYAGILVGIPIGRLVMGTSQVTSSVARRGGKVVGASALSTLIFFVLSNFGVWMTSSFYSKDLAGLGLCFIMAIPFYPNTLASTVIYLGVFVAAAELLQLSRQQRFSSRSVVISRPTQND